MSSQTILSVNNLSVSFTTNDGIVDAVKNVSFELQAGETLSIVGESGSGKSVSTNALMKLLPDNAIVHPDSSIMFEGESILDKTERQMQRIRGDRIGMIFQEPMTSLNPYMRVGIQVAEAMMCHRSVNQRKAKERVLELFDLVHLPNPQQAYDKYPHEFSGGQLQRIMIAMALINEPDILIADEPTTALDVTVQAEVLLLIKEIQAKMGMAILFITHDLGVVKHFADRVLVMCKGEVVEEGITEHLFSEPQHEYTKMLINSIPKGSKTPVDEKASELLNAEDIRVKFLVTPHFIPSKNEYFEAVKGISLQLKQGETLGIVGESGSGKSTLGRALIGLLPSTGKIEFKGQNMASLSDKERFDLKKDVQMVFQDPYGSLSPRMTIGEIITEGLTVHRPYLNKKEHMQKARDVLREVRLDPASINRYPHEFSGGQRQRIAIARALILEPSFILLDEPTSALDRSVQLTVIDLLKDLQKKHNIGYLFISHDLSVVKALSDRVLVMQKGEVMEQGSTQEIFHHPKSEYTRKLIDASFDLENNENQNDAA
ncbi:ABC transporter ATP-binding protein [Vibrio parahaemolyticus]|uniref:ABC transporter ATP-binding protein n=1 Tax=Vibrio parahaemolyticus TaxID=670 RepID=UPI0011224400|nr:ABC transporter ATP-binding protein [Vibrio parahaemolyticus]EJG1065848.1 ABC transporter ATP-binding protein [Vibrio parahaemolyticus O1]EGR2044571.1 ABC transporter ATP-binding protein [Vibrio parahaemolyticus]MDF4634441.1 ABC transporter ATP-binding protein [Vibrio parahaemolyticus]TOC15071.1 microcin C ABC transporter ATP-binding protein [Vibrio parahaemolyticus]TOQ93573.1 microcin C ABC transporter ATP-binding protein [Vibrio parahaemolyticus]